MPETRNGRERIRPCRSRWAWFLTYAVAAGLLLPGAMASSTPSAPKYPPLPVADDGRFLTNLSAPSVSAGQSGTIEAWLNNPLSIPLDSVSLTLGVYAFEPFPGGASNTSVPDGSPVQLVGPNTSTSSLAFSWGTLAPGASVQVQATVVTGSNAPAGAYAIRVALGFLANGSAYWLASRGYFSNTEWQNASTLLGGNSTLNLTRLGVSGVIPETAVQVQESSVAPWLYLLLGAALVLAAAGGFYAIRRGPKSRSGAKRSPPESRALNALGKSRTSDGD